MIISPWTIKIANANKYYDAWSTRFKCKRLQDYYEGFQWAALGNLSRSDFYRPYTLNVVYSSIKAKLANIIIQNLQFLVSPRPGRSDWNQEFAMRSALLKQDVLNTITQNPSTDVNEDIKLAALDSFFRFGILEIGYSAEWLNPSAKPPLMASHEDSSVSPDNDEVIKKPIPIPISEQIYFKHISAKRFRVSTSDSNKLKHCSWCGYYEYMYRSVLENTKDIDFPKNLRSKYYPADTATGDIYFNKDRDLSPDVARALASGEVCKVWKIYDNISNKFLLLLEDENFEEIYEAPFERLPFATHRFDLRLEGWYPIPPVFQWLSPQDEINESREQMRRYRRRFTRKFEYTKGSIVPDELEKFKNEIDGEIIETKNPAVNGPAIRAINNPEIGISIEHGLITAKDDFDIVAGNVVARGRASDRQTATAVNKLAQVEEIRQSIEQIDFLKFISAAGREALLLAGERLSEGIWIKFTKDPGDEQSILQELQVNLPIFKYITSSDVEDGYDFDVTIDVINATPAQQAEQEQIFIKFLTLLTNFPMISLSPLLIRECAFKIGYRNERIIQEFQRAALLTQMEKASQMQNPSLLQTAMPGGLNNQQTQQKTNGRAEGAFTRALPNSEDQIRSQLLQQLSGNA